MFLVIGSTLDDHPRQLVHHLSRAGLDVALIVPEDLSHPGWRLRLGRPNEAAGVAGGRVIPAGEVEAVVSALPWVGPYDLHHVAVADREYIANEMTSFLLAWLSQLDCVILDRPTPLSLAGCGRSVFEWATIADRLGVPTDPAWRGPTIGITVVHGQPPRGASESLAATAVALAIAAERSLVTLRFAKDAGTLFVGADVRPEVGDEVAADALLAFLNSV